MCEDTQSNFIAPNSGITVGQQVLDRASSKAAGLVLAYDTKAKQILASPKLRAFLLQGLTEEFRDCDRDYIEQHCLGNDIANGNERLDTPHALYAQNDLNTVSDSPTEGSVIFDTLFSAKVPEEYAKKQGANPAKGEYVDVIINLEMQRTLEKDYPLPERSLYYLSRLISSQKDRDFKNSEYAKIRKVYSIWICVPPMGAGNTVWCSETVMREVTGTGKLFPYESFRYNKACQVYIFLGKDAPDDKLQVLDALWTLFAPNELPVEQKRAKLVSRYNLFTDQEFERGDLSVVTVGQGIYLDGVTAGMIKGLAQGRAEGEAKGRAEGIAEGETRGEAKGIASSVYNIMQQLQMGLEQAMDLAGVPAELRAACAEIVQAK